MKDKTHPQPTIKLKRKLSQHGKLSGKKKKKTEPFQDYSTQSEPQSTEKKNPPQKCVWI